MKYLIILLFSLLVVFPVSSQESKYKAFYIYKFLQNLDWPDHKVVEKYSIAVDDEEIFSQMTSLMEERFVFGKPVEVTHYNGSLNDIDLLFLSTIDESEFENLVNKAITNSTVIVTEFPGLAKKGATINLIHNDGKISFEVNTKTLEASSLVGSAFINAAAIKLDSKKYEESSVSSESSN